MGGLFGVASKKSCVFDLFFGTDYHSHLGTRRGGMAVYGEKGFDRAIHNIENSPFRTKFDHDVETMNGHLGIGCISDTEPQPLIIRSHHGTFAVTTVGKINNSKEVQMFDMEMTYFPYSESEESDTYMMIPVWSFNCITLTPGIGMTVSINAMDGSVVYIFYYDYFEMYEE